MTALIGSPSGLLIAGSGIDSRLERFKGFAPRHARADEHIFIRRPHQHRCCVGIAGDDQYLSCLSAVKAEAAALL